MDERHGPNVKDAGSTPARSTKFMKSFVIRSGFQYKCDHCEKCGHKFQLGESIGLASFKGIGNKTLCDPCAKEISI